MDDIAMRSASDLAAGIKNGDVSSVELVELYLERIGRLDGDLNAVVTLDAERAIARARGADADLRAGRVRGPLHGIPITVKDAIATAGIRTTSGSRELAGYVPLDDAPAVGRLRAAGAIVIGKTNLPTFASGQETHSEMFGTTRNPWDTSRTPGGSSGGAAVAIAVGLSSLELGSDLAGSIRQPAHCCGVYGHYPTRGVVPFRGHIPPGPHRRLDLDMASLGPLGRSADDLELALLAMAGADGPAARGWRVELPRPRRERLRDYRVLIWSDDDDCPISSDVAERLASCVDALAHVGVRIDTRTRPAPLSEHRSVFMSLLAGTLSTDLPDEIFDVLTGSASEVRANGVLRAAIDGTVQRHRAWLLASEHRARLEAAWADLFRDVNVVLCPVSPVPAVISDPQPDRLEDIGYRLTKMMCVDGVERPYTDQMVWSALAGVGGLPATVAPIGLSRDGLPVGVQIIGPHLEDLTCIDFARRLADVIGGFVPPERSLAVSSDRVR